MLTREAVVEHARKYLGVPFLHQGRSAIGMDCAGLIIRVMNDLNISSFDTREYGKVPNPNFLRKICEEMLVASSIDKVGAILLMRFTKEPQHLAIRTPIGIIHSYEGMKRVGEVSFGPLWRKRVITAFDFPGIT